MTGNFFNRLNAAKKSRIIAAATVLSSAAMLGLLLSFPAFSQTQSSATANAGPRPGTEASLRRYIESLEKGQPNYDEMQAGMADAVRQQLPSILALIKPWGALTSITFQNVDPQGMDVYVVTFEHGKAEWHMAPLAPDGKVTRRGFRPLP